LEKELKVVDVPFDDPQPASGALAEIAAGPAGPGVGAFFDLDGTLVAGFTATVHAGDRIRRRQARVGEVLGVVEAMMRYRFGRMDSGAWSSGVPATCVANLSRNWKRSATDCSSTESLPGFSPSCGKSCTPIRPAVIPSRCVLPR
jgi:hypothetical protein